MERTVAIRSASCSEAWHAPRQLDRSATLGGCFPYSILLTLDGSQPFVTASCVLDRPASLRMSLKRTPRATRAWSAVVDTDLRGVSERTLRTEWRGTTLGREPFDSVPL